MSVENILITTFQAFYDVTLDSRYNSPEYTIKAYNKNGVLIGRGEYVERTNTHFIAVFGNDYTTENANNTIDVGEIPVFYLEDKNGNEYEILPKENLHLQQPGKKIELKPVTPIPIKPKPPIQNDRWWEGIDQNQLN